VIEVNDALSGRVFDHRVILRTSMSRVQVFAVDSHAPFRLCGANPQECTACAWHPVHFCRSIARARQSPYNLISHSKADDRVGKLIDATAYSQSGRIAEMPLSTGRSGVSRMGMR